jgi:hypothetical protein
LEQVIRREAELRLVSATEFERVFEAVTESVREDLREPLRERYRKTSTSRIRPPISALWLAADGRVWATFGDSALGERPQASVFDTLGRWEGDIELPTGFRISQIAADGILGTIRDEDGYYLIRFYRLRRD